MNKYHSILLVDDDEISNFINQQIITSLQLTDRVYTSRNGMEALKFLEEFNDKISSIHPELILLDIKMPIMDGLEFLKAFPALFLEREHQDRPFDLFK